MDAHTRWALREDVSILPVAEIDAPVRAELDCEPEDFVISQRRGRASSILVDAFAAELVRGFEKGRTVAEAVLRYCLPRRLDPEEALEASLPLVERLARRGFLVDAGVSTEPGRSFRPGECVGDLTVLRVLQVLDDCELYQVRTSSGATASGVAALKLGRGPAMVSTLDREAAILEHLGGEIGPRLHRRGTHEGRPYLLLEWCHGVDGATAAAEWRRRFGAGGRRRLLELCRGVVDAYAGIHRCGVLHGDVHPRNVLVDRAGRVRLVDFGAARRIGEPAPEDGGERPGVPFYFEPEYARAVLAGGRPPPVRAPGEQFAVAALLYRLAAGVHYADFGLERRDLLRLVAAACPAPFEERGLVPWPDFEAVLRRALACRPEERFPSMAAFGEALASLDAGGGAPAPSVRTTDPLAGSARGLVERAGLEGPWFREGLGPPPTASVTYGAAGVAYALYRVACQRDDAGTLALADLWARRAERQADRDEGFYSESLDLGRETLGESTPYHAPSGVFAVAATIAAARSDPHSLAAATAAFVDASARPAAGLDLTLGRSGTLLASALLEDLFPQAGAPSGLRELGTRTLEELWDDLDQRPSIAGSAGEYLGIAHGWAGFLYASLQWCRAADRPLPGGVERRLAELVALAEPAGRGLAWPRTVPHQAPASGWCHGSAGHVFLWSLAARFLDRPACRDPAVAAGWDAWDAPEPFSNLCCGLAGRAYAMLRLYKDTGERLWLERARDLARRAARERRFVEDVPHSLYKGEIVLAVLEADLERPDEAVLPFFEEEG